MSNTMTTHNPMVKTRFAPSPTGLMHLGNARTALFNAVYAYHCGGVFLLRIEDTDSERSQTEYSHQLLADLRWLGLQWQQGPEIEDDAGSYYQSQRLSVYTHYYAQLQQQHQVYPCFCTPQELALSRKLQRVAGQAPRYAGSCAHLSEAERQAKYAAGLKPTLRFRVPSGQKIQFTDLVRGQQHFISDDIGDFIIRRADGTPAFFFCNAVDDALMGVTHVLRGEDHLTNTPRQQLILEALGLSSPNYGHIALILGDDGTPLSKRNGSQSIQALRAEGYLAAGIVNYLARLGHSYTQDELLSLAHLAEHFAIERLGRAPARFDSQQLRHWQQMALMHSDQETLWQWMGEAVHTLVPADKRDPFIQAIKPNITSPQEALHWAEIFFTPKLTIQTEAQAVLTTTESSFFHQALQALEATQADYSTLVQQLKHTTGAKGKRLFMPLRAALTGEIHGPEMIHVLPLLGLERARQRLEDQCYTHQE